MNETKYIGFIEHNDWEGEDFGYYFEDTEEARQLLNQVEQNWGTNEADTTYSLDLGPYTSRELEMIEHGAGNGYMARCSVCTLETLREYVLVDSWVENEKSFVYKGNFLVNGVWTDIRG